MSLKQNNNNIRYIFILLFLFCLLPVGGCALTTNFKALIMLKRLSSNQQEIQEYVNRQETLFLKLKDDALNNRLKYCMGQSDVIKLYGEPIVKRESGLTGIKEIFLYRHPTTYFNTDIITLNFNENKRLVGWQLD